jgi:hypothetical protein
MAQDSAADAVLESERSKLGVQRNSLIALSASAATAGAR